MLPGTVFRSITYVGRTFACSADGCHRGRSAPLVQRHLQPNVATQVPWISTVVSPAFVSPCHQRAPHVPALINSMIGGHSRGGLTVIVVRGRHRFVNVVSPGPTAPASAPDRTSPPGGRGQSAGRRKAVGGQRLLPPSWIQGRRMRPGRRRAESPVGLPHAGRSGREREFDEPRHVEGAVVPGYGGSGRPARFDAEVGERIAVE